MKSKLVFYDLSRNLFTTSIWYFVIFLLIHYVTLISLGQVEDTLEWTILDSAIQSSSIYFMIMGILFMRGALDFYLSHGVTRKDYFIGNVVTIFCFTTGFVLIIAVLYLLEGRIFAMMDWQMESSSVLGVSLLSCWFQLIVFYLVGWFISIGFYRFHWLIGMVNIGIGVIMFMILDNIWEGKPGLFGWLNWPQPDPFIASGISLFLIILFLLANWLGTRKIPIKV